LNIDSGREEYFFSGQVHNQWVLKQWPHTLPRTFEGRRCELS